MTPLLLIHAGMRPGELIIAHADGSNPVFVPATDLVHRFEIGKNTQMEEWALLRAYGPTQQPDPLLTFDNEASANAALQELHKALLEPAPAPQKRQLSFKLPENWAPLAAVAAFILLVAGLSYCGKRPAIEPDGDPAPQSGLPALPGSPSLPPAAVMPEEAALPPSGALSPGDAILQQIQQAPAANGPVSAPAPQPAPQPAPASPGDALLQQIGGG